MQAWHAVVGVLGAHAGSAVTAHAQAQHPFLAQTFFELDFDWCLCRIALGI